MGDVVETIDANPSEIERYHDRDDCPYREQIRGDPREWGRDEAEAEGIVRCSWCENGQRGHYGDVHREEATFAQKIRWGEADG